MAPHLGHRRFERVLSEHSGRQLLLLKDDNERRAILRRFRLDLMPEIDGNSRVFGLRLLQNQSFPGLATVFEAGASEHYFEVLEAFLNGPSLLESIDEVHRLLPVTLGLAMAKDLARGLQELHEIQEPSGSPAHLIHGDISLNHLVLSMDGQLRLVGVTGLRGDPRHDVKKLVEMLLLLLKPQEASAKGRALLARIQRFEAGSAADLSQGLNRFLAKVDPALIAAKRRAFAGAFARFQPEGGVFAKITALARDDLASAAPPVRNPSQPPPMRRPASDASPPPLPRRSSVGASGSPPPLRVNPGASLSVSVSQPKARHDPSLGRGRSRSPKEIHEQISQVMPTTLREGRRQQVPVPADNAPPRPPPKEPEIGELSDQLMAGAYRVVGSIGRGGMGEVYLARDVRPGKRGRLVALKVLGTGHDDEDYSDALGMLMDEASIMAQIKHPNVLRVIDFQKAKRRYFLATEYLEGRPLVRVMIDAYDRPEGLSYPDIAAIGAQAADGLHAAHTVVTAKGKRLHVVHRDVSPQNIFVTYQGRVKVLDFGVARATERVSRTQAGLVKGKAAYMSPEQAEGRDLDGRSDVFALGICLWEMTAGRRLFKRESEYETLLAVQTDPVPSPTRSRGNPDPAFDRIILGALERDLGRRTPSAEALATQLREYAERHNMSDLERESARLITRLYGNSAEQERKLIQRLEEEVGGGTTLGEALEAMESPEPNTTEITMAADPYALKDLDDFGTRTGVAASELSDPKIRMIAGLKRAQAEREARLRAQVRSISGSTQIQSEPREEPEDQKVTQDTKPQGVSEDMVTEVHARESSGLGLGWLFLLLLLSFVSVGAVLWAFG